MNKLHLKKMLSRDLGIKFGRNRDKCAVGSCLFEDALGKDSRSWGDELSLFKYVGLDKYGNQDEAAGVHIGMQTIRFRKKRVRFLGDAWFLSGQPLKELILWERIS